MLKVQVGSTLQSPYTADWSICPILLCPLGPEIPNSCHPADDQHRVSDDLHFRWESNAKRPLRFSICSMACFLFCVLSSRFSPRGENTGIMASLLAHFMFHHITGSFEERIPLTRSICVICFHQHTSLRPSHGSADPACEQLSRVSAF